MAAVTVAIFLATTAVHADGAPPPAKVAVALYGDNGCLASLLSPDRYAVRSLTSLDPASFGDARVLVLQNVTTPAGPDSPLVTALARFVKAGGALMLCGDTCRFVASPLPRAMQGCLHPPEAADGWHIADPLMKVTDGRWIIEEFTGLLFDAGSPRHFALQMGPEGRTIILDRYDRPVVIGGPDGAGRVIFSGCDYTRLKVSSQEAEVTRTLLDYLAGFAGGPR